jgi:hypothetical protein
MTKVDCALATLLVDVPAAPKPKRQRTEAQRAAFEALRPQTRQDGVGQWWAAPALAGATLYHAGLGLRLAYRCTFTSRLDGETYIVGEVAGQGPGTALAVGGTLSCRVEALRRVVGPGVGSGEEVQG